MAYVAVRGGSEAIEASIERLGWERLKHGLALAPGQARAGLRVLIDQVMSEGSLYDEEIAALAVKQAEGSPEEAVFLLRAFRSTLPRLHYSEVVHTSTMRVERRISAAFKDIPGGQVLGASTDYTHRLLDPDLASESGEQVRTWLDRYAATQRGLSPVERLPKVVSFLRAEGLLPDPAPDNAEPKDVTKHALEFPTVRSERLQILTRGQTGAVTALGYASLRGYGALHPTVGELRVGMIPLAVADPEADSDNADDSYYIGEVRITEVESLIPITIPKMQGKEDLRFEIGYGACYGHNETKAIAMSILDQCLETGDGRYPTHDEEFVLLHVDSVEASGFISHLKLPHYVTFQSKLDAMRATKRAFEAEAVSE